MIHNVIIGGDFTNANLTDAYFTIYEYSSADFTGADLTGLRIYLDRSADFGQRKSLKQARENFVAGLSVEQRKQIIWDDATVAAGSRCIATAAFGTDTAYEVGALRKCRDVVLKRTGIGRICIALYEKTSPPIARMIADSPAARKLARRIIVRLSRLVEHSAAGNPGHGGPGKDGK
jgi:hypothetical protein